MNYSLLVYGLPKRRYSTPALCLLFSTGWLSFLPCAAAPISKAVTVPIDPDSYLISPEALKAGIDAAPSSSIINQRLLKRAQVSHLQAEAYNLYATKAKIFPNDPYAILWRGVAAEKYFRYISSPSNHSNNVSDAEANEIYHDADLSLNASLKQKPYDALMNIYCGSFLFWFPNNDSKREAQGLNLMKKAAAIDPTEPSIHATLGDAYASPVRPFYNPALAKRELQEVLRLSPTSCSAYWNLTLLDIAANDYRSANTDFSEYLKLVDPARDTEAANFEVRSFLNKHLGKHPVNRD